MAYRHFKGQLREDPSKYLFDIPEAEDEAVQVVGWVQDGQRQEVAGAQLRDVAGASRAIQNVIDESAMQLDELKITLRKFLEDNMDDFSGKIAQTLLFLGYANTEGLCTEQTGREIFLKVDEINNLLKNQLKSGRDRQLDELAAQLNDVIEQCPKGKAAPNPTVLGEISKNIRAINNKLDETIFWT